MSTSRSGIGHGGGFWVVAAAFLTTMAFSTLPTPLYALYQQRDGFSTVTVTVVFAAYAVGVMASLYLAGHVSDGLGRRRVVLAAVALELLSAGIFLLWPEVPGLLAARLVSGLGVGAITATATAHLAELRGAARPQEHPGRAALVSTAVNTGGLALGPLVAGALAEWGSSPLTTPYAIFVVLLAVSAVAVALVPETVDRGAERYVYRPQRVSLPGEARSTFAAAAAGAAAAFAIFGLFTSLAPTFLSGTLHETSRLLAGAVTFAVFAASAVSQIALAGLAARTQLLLGLALVSAGLIGVGTAVPLSSLALFVAGGTAAGAGGGLVFRRSVATASALAAPGSRGEVLAAIFLIAYVGLALPALALGAALTVAPSTLVLPVFALAVLVVSLWSGARMLTAPPAERTPVVTAAAR
ncbi:MFS transporter [Umezawaea beigongshangensis]|uniref:MFS transporter n=1 Tax=Umezawaea beigongshangensis TaxID=2780383 RepID=UPI0027DC5AFC|nr:MFS transporter [Umezawaea beigongshangensis]